MKRSFLATTALVAVFAFMASTASAQTTFLMEDWTGQSGPTVSGWSVFLLAGNDNAGIGAWRFDDPGLNQDGNGAAGAQIAPFVLPVVMSDSDATGGGFQYTSAMQSAQVDVSGAGQVLCDYDYVFAALGSTATFEVWDGSAWNVIVSEIENDAGSANGVPPTSNSFDVTAAMAGSTKGQIRFVHSGNFAWWYSVDNILLYEPAPVNVACTSIDAPIVLPNACIHVLTNAETVTTTITNAGSAPVVSGVDLIFVAVDFDTINVLNESFTPGANVAPGGTVVYSTVGTVDMSATGAHTLDVHATITGDSDPSNDTCTFAYTSPSGGAPSGFGFSESFDSLPGLDGTQVPAGWINAQDDPYSLASTSVNGDWKNTIGKTPSTNASPLDDHTQGPGGSGVFMYIEDSQTNLNDIELRSPCLDTAGAVGTPTIRFWYANVPTVASGLANDLNVDIINESTGMTTPSVLTLGGEGDMQWHTYTIDLTAFAGSVVRAQFRANSGVPNFVSDVSIDDVSFFDAVLGMGQAPQPGFAVFDINTSINGAGDGVSVGGPGPFNTNVTLGGPMAMTWSGLPAQGVICWSGPLLVAAASFAGVGQFDTGDGTTNMFGIPNGLALVGDGIAVTMGGGSFFDTFFFTGIGGTGGVSLIMPDFFPAGVLATLQCAMQDPVLGIGQVFISNAITVNLVP